MEDLRSIAPIDHADWCLAPSTDLIRLAHASLEQGLVLFLPKLAFEIGGAEAPLFSAAVASAKNVSFDPMSARLGGTSLTGSDRTALCGLMQRFSDRAASLAAALFPEYDSRLRRARTSFRPVEIAGRVTSWRQDDTRLHIDSFPATPVGGQRILRVFTNVNPHGRPRSWRVGEDFEKVAVRFAARLRLPLPGTAAILRLLRITKSRRSPYDTLMLQLHDAMKADTAYQAQAPCTAIDFPAGSTWMAFTDEVSHAAMAGQYQLEQTFLLPVDAMSDPQRSPLRLLERLKGRRLTTDY